MRIQLFAFLLTISIGSVGFGQNKPDPYGDCRVGDTKLDNQIFESEFKGQTRLRMVNRRNKEIKGYEFLSGEFRIKDTDIIGKVNKGGELSPEAIDLLENSGGKLVHMTVTYIDLMGKQQTRKSLFAVIKDRPTPETDVKKKDG